MPLMTEGSEIAHETSGLSSRFWCSIETDARRHPRFSGGVRGVRQCHHLLTKHHRLLGPEKVAAGRQITLTDTPECSLTELRLVSAVSPHLTSDPDQYATALARPSESDSAEGFAMLSNETALAPSRATADASVLRRWRAGVSAGPPSGSVPSIHV